ncbi:hypothetical protein V2G26_001884 [Clonostachys chloroleuca]
MAAVRRRASRLVILTGAALLVVLFHHLVRTSSSSSSSFSSFSRVPPPADFIPSSFNWSAAKQFYPPDVIKSLPKGKPRKLPAVQAPRSAFTNPDHPDPRRDDVLRVFKRSYNAYRDHAWLRDELKPVSGGGRTSFGGWAATLIDSLDTLLIMGLDAEFREASNAVAAIDFSKTRDTAVNLFEMTIRHLGGLISAYELSGEERMLHKAVEVGEMLYVAFDTPNRLPGFWLNFDNARQGRQVAGVNDPVASPASLCLEFTRLSQLTGDPKFYDATDRVTRVLERMQEDTGIPGLWPVFVDFQNEVARSSVFSIGGQADSLYEYLPKMHVLLGGVDETYKKMYLRSMEVVKEHLLFRPMLPNGEDILFVGDARLGKDKIRLIPDGQHLSCFAGGMFGLGGKVFGAKDHVSIGERLTRGCGWAYNQFPTGLMPELFTMLPCETLDECEWDEHTWRMQGDQQIGKGWKSVRDPRYILRPEAIESIFLLYRMTGEDDLREMAWEMFQSIVRSTETKLAYSAIKNVRVKGETVKEDSMESFWMAETLKYFYLIFSPPDFISLDDFVFSTEAHPFKRPG